MENLYLLGFVTLILIVLFSDLLLIGRKSHVLSFKESILWTCLWILLAIGFYLFILHFGEKLHGIKDFESLSKVAHKYAPALHFNNLDFSSAIDVYRKNLATEFLTGYFLEYTLSVDNIFVIMMILASFSVPIENYKKVLFWGILGAIILRCLFIFIGSALIQRFEWILLIFGAFLVYSGIKMFLERNQEETIEVHDHFL
jgi:tellurite resistance protein TerC